MKKILLTILGSLIISLSYTIFFIPNNIITANIYGLTQFANNILEINPGIILLTINLIFLSLSMLLEGKEKSKKHYLTTILIPVLTYILYNYTWKINLTHIDPLLLVIAGSYIMGYGISMLNKYSIGQSGLTIMEDIIKKRQFTYIIEAIIIILTLLSYNLESAIYTTISIIIINYMSTKSKIGISKNKTFYIITTKEKEIKDYLIKELNHDYTEFNVKGGYTNNKSKIIMTVVETKDYYRLKEGINYIDNKAFVFILDNYEVINKNVSLNNKDRSK